MNRSHKHNKLFSEIHSTMENEWQSAREIVPDDDDTAKARKLLDLENLDSVLPFAQALCFQLRYGECLNLYTGLEKKYSENYAFNRRMGVLYFKLLQFDKCIEKMIFCLNNGNDALNDGYILAFAYFCNGNFSQAEKALWHCAELSEGNGEMYVAVLFWLFCCLKRQNKQLDGFYNAADKPFDCGHHIGYDSFVKFASGKISEGTALTACETDTDLNKICLYYGMSVFFEDDPHKHEIYLQKTLAPHDLFGAYAYIAAYADSLKNNVR